MTNDEKLQNLQNVKEYLGLNNKNLCFFNLQGFGEVETFQKKVIVHTAYNNGYINISIMWEDDPLYLTNYKKIGLYGYYSTNYCKCIYDKDYNVLKIYDSNGRIIKLTIV